MKQILALLYLIVSNQVFSQGTQNDALLISGPMLGFVEHRSAYIWFEVSQEVKNASIRYWEHNNIDFYYEADYKGPLGNPYNPVHFELFNLKMNTPYQYSIVLNNKEVEKQKPYQFRTRDLWQYRKDPPDFSFMMGSCAYINDEQYDRPGPAYGQDPAILTTMGNYSTDFMLWMGDNLYFREADYSSRAGMQYRYSYNRRIPQMRNLLSSRSNFAIWDDHDYGPNDSDESWEFKDESLDLFKKYWGNKTYGETNNEGIYSKISWSDCDFFLMDDRYHRSPGLIRDSVNGESNCEKQFYGIQQLTWLENNLLNSFAPFKFIVTGSQVLNPMNKGECLRDYPCEYNELLNFITEYKIDGVIFLSGDRHFSEVIKYQPKKGYAIYDITSSPITSGVYNITGTPEFTNPNRVPETLVMENNFTVINIKGKPGERVLQLKSYNKGAEERSNFTVSEKELRFKN